MLFQAFVNDTGRPWRPRMSLVSKTESKSTVLFPPLFVSTTEELFLSLGILFLQVKMSTDSTSHGQVLQRCPLSICAKDAACMR